MDPFLEPHWFDVHSSLVVATRDELNQRLPEDLVARSAERVAVESEDAERQIGPGVRVFSPSNADTEESEGGIALDAPFKLVLQDDPIIERFIRIIDEAGQIVTYWNTSARRTSGRRGWMRIDRNGASCSTPMCRSSRSTWFGRARPDAAGAMPRPGRLAVPRHDSHLGKTPLGVPLPDSPHARHLPEIPVPLRPTDAPVKLPLQSLIERVYQNGRYGRTLDYRQPLDPPFDGEDAAQIREILGGKSEGSRG